MRFRHHVFICENRRPEGDPRGSCGVRGSEAVRQAFKEELARRGLKSTVSANAAGCLDACAHGPSVVVYPEGVWYGHVRPEDVPEIVERHLVGGEPVERLRLRELEGGRKVAAGGGGGASTGGPEAGTVEGATGNRRG